MAKRSGPDIVHSQGPSEWPGRGTSRPIGVVDSSPSVPESVPLPTRSETEPVEATPIPTHAEIAKRKESVRGLLNEAANWIVAQLSGNTVALRPMDSLEKQQQVLADAQADIREKQPPKPEILQQLQDKINSIRREMATIANGDPRFIKKRDELKNTLAAYREALETSKKPKSTPKSTRQPKKRPNRGQSKRRQK